MDKAKSYFACFSFFDTAEVNEDELNRLTQELEDTKVNQNKQTKYAKYVKKSCIFIYRVN